MFDNAIFLNEQVFHSRLWVYDIDLMEFMCDASSHGGSEVKSMKLVIMKLTSFTECVGCQL